MTTLPYTQAYLPVVSGDSAVWGTKLNTLTFVSFDNAIGGVASQTLTNADVTLSATQSSMMILSLNGTLTKAVTLTTAKQGIAVVYNFTTGNYPVTYTNGVGATVVLPQGYSVIVSSDATSGCFLIAAAGINAVLAQEAQSLTASSSTLTIDMSKGWNVDLTLSANITAITVTNWPASKIMGKLLLNITTTGSYTITGWPGTTKWTFGVPPTVSTGAGAQDSIVLMSDDGGSNFKGYYVGKAFA